MKRPCLKSLWFSGVEQKGQNGLRPPEIPTGKVDEGPGEAGVHPRVSLEPEAQGCQ